MFWSTGVGAIVEDCGVAYLCVICYFVYYVSCRFVIDRGGFLLVSFM